MLVIFKRKLTKQVLVHFCIGSGHLQFTLEILEGRSRREECKFKKIDPNNVSPNFVTCE